MIEELSYVVIRSPSIEDWVRMARDHIGFHVDETKFGTSIKLRMDQKVQRFIIQPISSTESSSVSFGFGVADAVALAKMQEKISTAGIITTPGLAEEIELRGVDDMFHFNDPDGYRVEISTGLADSEHPVRYGRPIGGFLTGQLGLGHIALKAAHFDEMSHLYKNVLGFRVSDYSITPFRTEFLHVNPRHHTVGLADVPGAPGVYHLMVEYNEFDDVGRAYDIALENPELIGVTLGRHLNDHVTSFYLKTPDGWFMELGWAGRTIEADWKVTELPGLSLWGHDRTWLPPAQREKAKQILKKLSEQGMRAPVVSATQSKGEK